MITPIISDLLIKGWIIRLFREARADLSASYEIEEPFISTSLIVQSMKKLQKVILFCLGEPDSIQELLMHRIKSANKFYELLFSVQDIINYWISKILTLENLVLSELILDARKIFEFAKIFIIVFIDKKIPYEIETFPEKNLGFKAQSVGD